MDDVAKSGCFGIYMHYDNCNVYPGLAVIDEVDVFANQPDCCLLNGNTSISFNEKKPSCVKKSASYFLAHVCKSVP